MCFKKIEDQEGEYIKVMVEKQIYRNAKNKIG